MPSVRKQSLLVFLRGAASFVLILAGTALFLFSIAVAFGWDRGPFSFIGTIIAVLGLSFIFAGYWLIRNSEGAPLAAACLKLALGFGSTFLVFGVLALFLAQDLDIQRRISLRLAASVFLGLSGSAPTQGATRSATTGHEQMPLARRGESEMPG